MTDRQKLFVEIKDISDRRGIPLVINGRVSIAAMKVEFKRLTASPFLEQITAFDLATLKPAYKYTESPALGMRTYFVNRVNVSTYDVDTLKFLISNRLKHARKAIVKTADVHIRLVFKDNGRTSSKSFNTFLLKDEDKFWNMIQLFNDTNTANTPDYTNTVVAIQIKIIRPNAGGCVEREHRTKIGNVTHVSLKSSNNNCLFSCIFELINIGKLRMSRLEGNKIRAKFNIKPDEKIPIVTALKIFKHYRRDPLTNIKIVDNETLQESETGKTSVTHIVLANGHYSLVEFHEVVRNRCEDCGKYWVRKHNCVQDTVQYYNAKIKNNGKRYLLCRSIIEKTNTQDNVIHYDLETHQDKTITVGEKIHTPYIVGYTEGTEFKHIAGDNCIKDFVTHILDKSEEMCADYMNKLLGGEIEGQFDKGFKSEVPTLYVNAFNGANFDHYALFKEFMRRGLKPEKQIINNGSIISFKYGNLKLFDVCKHLQGSLADNLKALKCDVQKGDFNHDNASRWEVMSEELRSDCLKYLRSDVMGLQELYNKVNTNIFDTHQVNISSYISTSSLTFNLWKKNISKQYSIELPTLHQEKAFRQSVRGGRTYKAKHRYTSHQYEAFKAGNIEFSDITDHMVDADVVSLYPTAMAHFPYPVGECIELKELGDMSNNTNPTEHLTMMGAIGIYFITYIANKNISHAIGGRRDEHTGALKWDLKDEQVGGWYTSPDIEDMMNNGYTVSIKKGFYWNEVAYIFKDYIEELFKKKDDEAKAGRKGSVAYQLCKLFMNALYGKNIQRPIYTETKIITSNVEYWKFWGTHIITEITDTSNDIRKSWFISGTPRDVRKTEKCITKPTHLGAFILAYSRRVMVGYLKESNPYFDITRHIGTSFEAEARQLQMENDIYYTDTDSLHIHITNARLISKLGLNELGGITDDLGPSCKIMRGIWIAPKLYALEYVKEGDATIHYHFRGKGLNKSTLTIEQFEAMDRGEPLVNTRNFAMKKINVKRNGKQEAIPMFSILHYSKDIKKDASKLTRTVNTSAWSGRQFTGNSSVPWV